MDNIRLIESLNENAPEYRLTERRNGKDAVIKIINFVGCAIWAVFIIVTAIIKKASYLAIAVSEQNGAWNQDLLNIAIIFTMILFFICAACILISLKRIRRRKDKIKISFFICELITFAIGIFLMYGVN